VSIVTRPRSKTLTDVERVVPELVVLFIRYALILGQLILGGRCKVDVLPSISGDVDRR
jgi:hypothetical protein